MLSRLVITFLLRRKRLLISWLQSPSAVTLEPKKIKSLTISPSICHEEMEPDAMILVFWMLSFTLQYCSGFCHTLTRISHGCTCVLHPEPLPTSRQIPSLRVIPVYQPWAPCLMRQTWTGDLFHIWQYTCFNAILSNLPPSPSTTETKRLFYTCVSLLLSHI